ncbi:hypothetical protein ACLIOZ_001397 [Klebsiella pneumoniae]
MLALQLKSQIRKGEQLASAGELSIREQKFLKLAKEFRICSASLDAAIKTGNVLADQNAQLAAENVALKQAAEFATASDMWIEQADGMLDYRYHEWYVDVLKTAMETPATDAYLAGIKADGVEEFAAKLRIPGDDPFMDAIADSVAGAADSYAKQLREGAK